MLRDVAGNGEKLLDFEIFRLKPRRIFTHIHEKTIRFGWGPDHQNKIE